LTRSCCAVLDLVTLPEATPAALAYGRPSAQPGMTVQFATASATVNQNAGTFSVPVTLSRTPGGPNGPGPNNGGNTDVIVPFSLGGTAVGGIDYADVTPSPLVIPAGQTAAVISGTLLSPGGQTANPTLVVTLGTPVNAALGNITTTTLTILHQAATTTSLTSSAGTSVYGQSVTFTATVSSGANPATGGTITFEEGNTVLAGPMVLDASGKATFTTAALSAAGSPHVITAVYSGTSQLPASAGSVTQTVNRRPLTITADDKTKVYGRANPTFTVTYDGFVNGNGPASLGGALDFHTAATAASHVAGGPYAVTPGGLTSANYAIVFVGGHLTVTPAPLTVTANDATTTFGVALPRFTARYVGLVNGDTPASLGGTLSFATSAKPFGPVSGSPVAITPSGLTSPDYHITFVNGRLTIVPAPSLALLVAAAAAAPLAVAAAAPPLFVPALPPPPPTRSEVTPNPNGGPLEPSADLPPAPVPDQAAQLPAPAVPAAIARTRPKVRRMSRRSPGRNDRDGDDDDRDQLFAEMGVGPLYKASDLFGDLLGGSTNPEQENPPPPEEEVEADTFMTTMIWFVMITVACEATLVYGPSSS
jgi:hypothetical protein